MANCVVFGCSNSYYKLQRWCKTICTIHKIRNDQCSCNAPFQLFPFPTKKHPEERQKWIKNVNRADDNGGNWEPKPESRICSKHFVDGTPTRNNCYPTLHMGHDVQVLASRKAPKVRTLPITSSTSSSNKKNVLPKTINQINSDINHDHSYKYSYVCECSENCSCFGCISKEREIVLLKQKMIELEKKVAETKTKPCDTFNYKSFISSDKKVRRFLGLPNKVVFEKLVKMVTPKSKNLRYWRGCKSLNVRSTKVSIHKVEKRKPGPNRKLSVTQELVAVFLKLRLNLTNEFISCILNISPSLCSQIITTWLKFLAHHFKCLIYHPPKEEVKANLPTCFKEKVPNARSIIDCSEFFIETPNSLDVQAQTWSDYKHHNTLKCLVDITPTGIIQYISPAWGGRTSDKYIVLNSDYLDTIERGDTVLADRGFPIGEELLIRGAKLYIPPGARGMEQMTRDNVSKTKKVANLRIHVERAINRLKWFRILSQTIPISMAPLIDDILIVCAAMANLYSPLVKS